MSRLYHIYNLLILITILYLSPTWAQSVEPTDLAMPQSAWHPNGEIGIPEEITTVCRRTIVTASASNTTGIPKPFDTLSYNFANSTTCIDFFTKWRANTTISDCNAISLLIENSNAFFHALSSAPATSRILDTSCSANVTQCASIMTALAVDLLKSDNCGEDYDDGNSVVKGTYRDLVAYEPMYRATCLTNPSSKDYCFVDAVSNSTAPDDYSVYLMPLGTPLTVGGVPTCNKCLKATMDIFSSWARRDGQSLDTTYLPSAKIINTHCGDGFVSTNVTVGSADVRAGAGLAVPLPKFGIVTVMASVLGVMLTGLF
ncbi:hypothetical protein PEX1_057540 [Penicillium expansum]|uniref:DUF7729 domain-containing protein n=1 Tax=Penicillium expansum TaxID=27334 RepID=A0A0A2I7T1_PENEN|nr:hypothetical protein PEX2_017110 [Penicillium expansum]KGO38493.1 hypothetical protein PEXP_055710 [Penicillium expansum]KGO61805.1 hypothetical protein PEX2_017110 [Penicillium expansum]KGO72723.1 hypothetical protein PEX1_057540 [Penicillium expansum]